MSTEVQWFIILSLLFHGSIYLFVTSAAQVVSHKEITMGKHLFVYPTSYAIATTFLVWGPGEVLRIFGLLLCLTISAFCFFMAIQAFRADPQLWEENRQAIRLARKLNRGKEITPEEESLFKEFRNKGVLSAKPIGLAYSRRTNRFVSHVWKLADHRLDAWFRKPFW